MSCNIGSQNDSSQLHICCLTGMDVGGSTSKDHWQGWFLLREDLEKQSIPCFLPGFGWYAGHVWDM